MVHGTIKHQRTWLPISQGMDTNLRHGYVVGNDINSHHTIGKSDRRWHGSNAINTPAIRVIPIAWAAWIRQWLSIAGHGYQQAVAAINPAAVDTAINRRAWIPIAGAWIPISGTRLSNTGIRLPIAGASAINRRGMDTNLRDMAIKHRIRLSISGTRLPIAGAWLSISRTRLSNAGTRLPISGAWLSNANRWERNIGFYQPNHSSSDGGASNPS